MYDRIGKYVCTNLTGKSVIDEINVPIIVERLQNIAVIQSGYRINVITLVIK